jgi:hypothetical protein
MLRPGRRKFNGQETPREITLAARWLWTVTATEVNRFLPAAI